MRISEKRSALGAIRRLTFADCLRFFGEASSEKSVDHRYASMGAGSSARAAREPDVG